MTFSLFHSPWLPVRPVSTPGPSYLASLLEVFRGSADLDLAEYGLYLPAVVRQLLVPVVMDVAGTPTSPDEWLDLWDRREDLYPEIEEYLLAHDAWFTAGAGGSYAAWCVWDADVASVTWDLSALVPEVPSGTAVPLSRWQVAGDYAFTWPELLRGVLLTQCWDHASPKASVPGGLAKSAGTVSVLGRAENIMPVGRNLLDTTVLNVPIVPDGIADDDLPPWKRDLSIRGEDRGPRGVMELLTWQSRRIAMYTDDQGSPECCAVTAGDRYLGAVDYDPHVSWWVTKQGEPAARRVEPSTPTWLGLPALLAPGGHSETGGAPPQLASLAESLAMEHPDYPLRLHLAGVQYGGNSSCIDYVTTDTLPLDLALLRSDPAGRTSLDEAISSVGTARDAVGRMAGAVAQVKSIDTSKPNSNSLVAFKARWRGHLDQLLTPAFHRYLSTIDEPDALATWHRQVQTEARRVIDELVRPVPMQAYLRHGIARVEARQRGALAALASAP